jgi:8-hydroxy-5-deazaflavin:NADPH oxidoreductase
MNVSVIGTGNIGGTLGLAFARAGHAVTFGVRDPEEPRLPDGAPESVRVRDIGSALGQSDVVVLAVPGPAVPDLVREHSGALAGTLVVDATNTISGSGPAHSHDAIAGAAPHVRYARAFNTLGWENLRDPRFGDERADMFFSAAEGDRAAVAELIEAVGLRPVWLGDDAQDLLDGLLRLWFVLARTHGRRLAFRMLTDSGAA